MDDILATPLAADLVIGALVLESVLLAVLHRRSGRGIPPSSLLPGTLAGLGLALALRGALADAGAAWIGGALVVALASHLADLRGRWKG